MIGGATNHCGHYSRGSMSVTRYMCESRKSNANERTFSGSFGLSEGCGTRMTSLNRPLPCLSWSRGMSAYSGGQSSWSLMKALVAERQELSATERVLGNGATAEVASAHGNFGRGKRGGITHPCQARLPSSCSPRSRMAFCRVFPDFWRWGRQN